MRRTINIDSDWSFTHPNGTTKRVDIPFTFNADDCSENYFRGACRFAKTFDAPRITNGQVVYLEFLGVNSVAEVMLNGRKIAEHRGGYSPFRVRIDRYMQAQNLLEVTADNSALPDVYPSVADFTFYGGIYRDVNLIVAEADRFELDCYGADGLKIDAAVTDGGGDVTATCSTVGNGVAEITVYDAEGNAVATGGNGETMHVKNARLWNGVSDPYLYTAKARLTVNGVVTDEISLEFGFKSFYADPERGFFLNGKPYPLKGVSRHQDVKSRGNAITKADCDKDISLIKEMGANAVRLAHYMHDDYFYTLCDKNGIIVWTEIPVISEYLPNGDDNALQQLKELIYTKRHHACICFWGIANEITMFRADRKRRVELLRKLNDFCKAEDPRRLTALACYSACPFWDKTTRITDVVGWNLYFGWYVPGKFLNGLWLKLFKLFRANRPLCFSEYGAEGMPGLHSARPRRGDNSEEYQLAYHEYMLGFFEKHPDVFAPFVWNMFDFGSAARDQGGEPSVNHKGLVTFDRSVKKDAFYLYKAHWSSDPFIHICGKRFINRHGSVAKIKVVTNMPDVSLTANGRAVKGKRTGAHSFEFKIRLDRSTTVCARCKDIRDECTFTRVDKPYKNYKLGKKSNMHNWQKK